MNKKLYIIMLLILSLLSCKSKVGSTDPTVVETRLLKIKAPVSYDPSIHIDMKAILGERVYEAAELANGVKIPINSTIDIVLETDATSFVFWSGRAITDENRRLKEFSLLMEEDTYLRVAVSSRNIETRKLDVLVGENGKLIANDEKYEGYNTISFAEGQIVDLEVVPDDGYFFTGWSGNTFHGYEKKRNITMDEYEVDGVKKTDRYLQVSFSDNVSVKLEIGEFENGTVLINGHSFDRSKEYIFHVGDWVTVEANPDNNFSFLAWAGTISSIESKHSFQIESDISITPVFESPNGVAIVTISPVVAGNSISYTVTRDVVTTSPTTISSSFNILYYKDGGADGALKEGDVITLTSTSAEGYLDGAIWTGDGPPNATTTKVFTMGSSSKGITATFKRKATKLTVKVVRQYDKNKDGTLVEETDPITGFYFTVDNSGWTRQEKRDDQISEVFNDSSNPANPNYGDIVKIAVDPGTHYTVGGIKLNTASTENVNSKTFTIKEDTDVVIYLNRIEYKLTLVINGGYYNKGTAVGELKSKAKIEGTGIAASDKDYFATTSPSTTYNNIRVLSGKTLTFTATGTAAHSFNNYTGGTTTSTINNLTANTTVNANFTNNKVNLTYNAKRLWTNDAGYIGFPANTSVDITANADVGGYYRKTNSVNISLLDNNTTSHTTTHDYGTVLTPSVAVDSTKFDTTMSRVVEGSAVNGSEPAITSITLEGSKTVTALIYHKVTDFNFQISGAGLSTSVTMSNSGTYPNTHSLTRANYYDGNDTTYEKVPVIVGAVPVLTAVAGNNNIFKGYASGLTAKRLTIYKPSITVELNAKFVASAPWTGGRTQPRTDASGWYLIYTPEELAWLDQWDKNTLDNKKVKVMNDINMANNSSFKGINTGSKLNNNPNVYYLTSFKFDGQSYEVANLNIDGGPSGRFYGLIGAIGIGSEVKNVSTSGIVKAQDNVAGIVAFADQTTISGCYNNSDVISTVTSGLGRPGGIASYILRATLSNCYNSGNIIATAEDAGGIVALSHNSSVIDSYNSGYVEAYKKVGGIVGHYQEWGSGSPHYIKSAIERVYNFGEVKAKNDIAGGIIAIVDVVARNQDGSGTGGLLRDSYTIGSVSGRYDIGAIVGNNSTRIPINNCYYVNNLVHTDGYPLPGVAWGTGTTTAKAPGDFATLHDSLGSSQWKFFDSPFNVVNGVSQRPVLIDVGEGAINP